MKSRRNVFCILALPTHPSRKAQCDRLSGRSASLSEAELFLVHVTSSLSRLLCSQKTSFHSGVWLTILKGTILDMTQTYPQPPWKVSIPFLDPAELEHDEPFPHAAQMMWQQTRMDFYPSYETMEFIKGVLANEMSYIERSGHSNMADVRLLQELLDQNIDIRSDNNWRHQVSKRLKAVAWRMRVQEHFLQAAIVLAQQGLIEPDFRTALADPIDIAGYETHPSVHAVETALRRFDMSWRILSISCFPEDSRTRRHIATPFPYPFSWLATVIARSAKTTEMEPILDVLKRSGLLGPLSTLAPPKYTPEAWHKFAATGRTPSPPGVRARIYNGQQIKLIDVIFPPAEKFDVDPHAGGFTYPDPRIRGGRRRGLALNFWLPAGMGSGEVFVPKMRKYGKGLWERRAAIKIAFEAWFGEGTWGDDSDAEEAIHNFIETATEGDGADLEFDNSDSEVDSEDEQSDEPYEADTEDNGKNELEPFPPSPDDWDFEMAR